MGCRSHLRTLAEHSALPLVGDSPDALASAYVKSGYRADDAVLRALACVKTSDDTAAVSAAIRSIYLGWLDDTARNFQAAARKSPLPGRADLKEQLVVAEPGECLLFVDGLRFDVAQRLLAKAHERQLLTSEGYRLSALPSVTPTAKPAVTPAALAVMGEEAGADFCPVIADGKRPVTAERLRDAITATGHQVLHGLDTGLPAGEDARAWTEHGEFDALGHKLQARLANQIEEQLDHVLERIIHLCARGVLLFKRDGIRAWRAESARVPISARKQLFDLPDALATKISIEFYADAKDAFLKALAE